MSVHFYPEFILSFVIKISMFFLHLNSTVFFVLILVFVPTHVCVCLELGFSSKLWSLSLIGSTLNSVGGTCCTTVHTKFHVILATFCPCDMSHEVQQVELCATCRGDQNIPQVGAAQVQKYQFT